jgi:PAS domain S-box-containing protein
VISEDAAGRETPRMPSQPLIATSRLDDDRLRAFLRGNFDILYDWNIQTGVIDFSEDIDHLLGYPPGGFPRTFAAWLENIHPDERADALTQTQRSISLGEPFRNDYRVSRTDGTFVLISDHGVVLPDELGRPAHMVGAMRDVTRQHEAEHALREAGELHRLIVEHIASPIMHADAEGRYLEVNPAAAAFFECSRDELLTRCVADDFGQLVMALMSCEDGTGGGEAEVDVRVGDEVKTLIVAVVPCGQDGSHAFIFGTDITGHKRLQEKLVKGEEALRHLAQSLDERNAALRVIIEQREHDRNELELRIATNISRLVDPALERLSRALRGSPEAIELEGVRQNLREIFSQFAASLSLDRTGREILTRREFAVANLVRLGRTTSEIAEALHISPSVVSFHRSNIRRKLGLGSGGPRLATYLDHLARAEAGADGPFAAALPDSGDPPKPQD